MENVNRRNRIIMFSGGKSSFSVAAFIKEHFPHDNILLYFNDTLWEDEDLYRFTHEASDKLELPMLTHSRGFTPIQLFVIQCFMGNSRAGTCSRYLKQKVAGDFFRHGKVPRIEKWYNHQFLKNEDFTTEPIFYFGIGFEEMHRAGPIIENWKPFEVEFPLIEHIIDNNKVLESFNIQQPRMYDLQFAHNNCAGRCVKAGQGHFLNLLRKNNSLFLEFKEQEIVVSEYIRYTKQGSYSPDRDYLIQEVWAFVSTGKKTDKLQHIINTFKYSKKHNIGGRNRPYSFIKNMPLEELEQKPTQLDIWDIGGCGCYSDFNKEEGKACEVVIG